MEFLTKAAVWLSEQEAALSAIAAIVVILGIFASPAISFLRSRRRAGTDRVKSGRGRDLPPDRDSATASIAVLPFRNLSEDPADMYLAEGLSTELIAALTRIPDVRVAPRIESFVFDSHKVTARDVARALEVRYVVTGTLQHVGDKLHVSAELADMDGRRSPWTRIYDRKIGDFFEVQEELAGALAAAIGWRARATQVGDVIKGPTHNLNAFALLQRAQYLVYTLRDQQDEALKLVRQAIEADHDYAEAHALLAALLGQSLIDGHLTDDAVEIPAIKDAAARAVRLRPSDPAVLTWSGWGLHCAGDFEGSERVLRRSADIAPYHTLNWLVFSSALATGSEEELKEAVKISQRLLEASGDRITRYVTSFVLAIEALRSGRYEEAALRARAGAEANARYQWAWMLLAAAFGHLGKAREARAAAAEARASAAAFTPAYSVTQFRRMARRPENVEPIARGLERAGLIDR